LRIPRRPNHSVCGQSSRITPLSGEYIDIEFHVDDIVYNTRLDHTSRRRTVGGDFTTDAPVRQY
jgi:hypothetical protein